MILDIKMSHDYYYTKWQVGGGQENENFMHLVFNIWILKKIYFKKKIKKMFSVGFELSR